MMIDVPSDAPNFTFTVANESPSRLLTWPEASLPATAVTGRIKASSTAVAVSTTVAFCPGRACTSFGNRHCSVRVDSVPCAVVADPAVSSADEGRSGDAVIHYRGTVRGPLRVGDLESARQRLVRVYGRQQCGRVHAGAHAAIPYREQRIVRGHVVVLRDRFDHAVDRSRDLLIADGTQHVARMQLCSLISRGVEPAFRRSRKREHRSHLHAGGGRGQRRDAAPTHLDRGCWPLRRGGGVGRWRPRRRASRHHRAHRRGRHARQQAFERCDRIHFVSPFSCRYHVQSVV